MEEREKGRGGREGEQAKDQKKAKQRRGEGGKGKKMCDLDIIKVLAACLGYIRLCTSLCVGGLLHPRDFPCL